MTTARYTSKFINNGALTSFPVRRNTLPPTLRAPLLITVVTEGERVKGATQFLLLRNVGHSWPTRVR